MSVDWNKFAARRAPVDYGASLMQDFIDGAVNNGFGRPVNIQINGMPASAFNGIKTAATTFGTSNGALKDILEIAGLGTLAVPVGYHLATKPEERSPTTEKVMDGTEMAGLGALAVPSIMNLLKK